MTGWKCLSPVGLTVFAVNTLCACCSRATGSESECESRRERVLLSGMSDEGVVFFQSRSGLKCSSSDTL